MIEDESASIKLDNFDETLHLNHRLPSAHKINHERDFKYFGKETESSDTKDNRKTQKIPIGQGKDSKKRSDAK